MPLLTLGQAARETGKQKSTILDAIRNGRLSATRDDRKQWQIDPAELFRVYPPQQATERQATHKQEPEPLSFLADLLAKEREERERERRLLESQLEDLKADRDHWRQQATALLTHQPHAPAEAGNARPTFWRRLTGRQ